ncbi:MAG: 4-hydroxyphenylacetate 3-hydroxylase [Candidatus Rokubacteria bacterium]|nr:4-hydroxyphenylacetate 3-hydroxylase [Candidatus Rokubacteria bacterium]
MWHVWPHMRSGDDYIRRLRDGRAIYLDGERVKDVTRHPAFAEPVRRVADIYDRARAAADDPAVTFVGPDGRRRSNMWLVPRSADDLAARRRVHRFWAEPTYGLMGRTPDHVACVLTAFASWRQLFDRAGREFGDRVVRFYERARDDDLYVAYAIVPPQIDRSAPAHRHPEPFLHPGVVRETDAGIVVRGSHAIATSVTMADWLFVSYITPLVPGDEAYAVSFVLPVDAEGLRLYPRRPYATMATSVYDYPLSSRFDEVDTTVVFDDVFVPWEQVFIDRNVELVNAQFHETPSHATANFQSLVRFGVKLEFLAGLAMKLAEVQGGDAEAGTQATLGGDIATFCATFDALNHAAERFPLVTDGVARPHPQYIYAGMSLQRRVIVDLLRTLRELAGGAFQNVPSSEANFLADETREHTTRYFQSRAAGARDRIKLVKLIWDFVGTEFGGRHLQYEMFYSASQTVVNRRMFRSYDWNRAKAMVDRCLGEY